MQISASLNKELVEKIKSIQSKNKGMSFSQMVETLLWEAVEARRPDPKPNPYGKGF